MLEEVIRRDNRVFPREKMLLIFGLIFTQVLISIFRGSGPKNEFGIYRCSDWDWILFSILCLACIIFEIGAIKVIRSEVSRKRQCGYEFYPGEFQGTVKEFVSYHVLSFFGSFAVAFCGATPGAIFGPVMLFFGMDTRTSFQTAVFMGMLNTGVATIFLIFYNMLRFDYALQVQIYTLIGTLIGISL